MLRSITLIDRLTNFQGMLTVMCRYYRGKKFVHNMKIRKLFDVRHGVKELSYFHIWNELLASIVPWKILRDVYFFADVLLIQQVYVAVYFYALYTHEYMRIHH